MIIIILIAAPISLDSKERRRDVCVFAETACQCTWYALSWSIPRVYSRATVEWLIIIFIFFRSFIEYSNAPPPPPKSQHCRDERQGNTDYELIIVYTRSCALYVASLRSRVCRNTIAAGFVSQHLASWILNILTNMRLRKKDRNRRSARENLTNS